MVAAVIASDNIGFEHKNVPVNDMRVKTEIDANGKSKVTHVYIQDEPIVPTDRFWVSLFSRYGFNKAFFKYYRHEEVFQRISEVEKNDRMRICIERGDKGSKLLAVTNPNKPLVLFDELSDLLQRYGGNDIAYANGVVESVHVPRNMTGNTLIGADTFQHRFLMSVPVDGYGLPQTYLSLLREICSNGVIGYTKVFRTQVALGKGAENVVPSLVRMLDGFGNDEGYDALRKRIASAQKSWASVFEAQRLFKLVVKLHTQREIDDLGGTAVPKGLSMVDWVRKGQGNVPTMSDDPNADAVLDAPIFRAFEGMAGNPSRLYGVTNIDALSTKRQKTLPVPTALYNLINFATEVATHYATPEGARKLQAWVGTTISEEYDMEGTMDKFGDFADFHMDKKLSSGMTGSEFAGEPDTGLETETADEEDLVGMEE